MFIGYYNKANAITLLGLFFSLCCSYFALNNNLRFAVIFIICAGICDLFDGAVARKIKRSDGEKAFGAQLDTVADMVSFCVAPAIIVYSQNKTAGYALCVCVFFIVCGCIRLAYFNTAAAQNENSAAFYHGVPVTYIALVLPIVLLFNVDAAAILTLAAMAVLFVLDIKIPKPRGAWYVIFPLSALAVGLVWWFK